MARGCKLYVTWLESLGNLHTGSTLPVTARDNHAAACSNKPTRGRVAGCPGAALGAGVLRSQAALGRWVVRAAPLEKGVQPPQRPPRDHRAEAAAARRHKPTPGEVAGGPGAALVAGVPRAQSALGR